jgi:hypothetical protein
MIDHVLTECNFVEAVWDRGAHPLSEGEDFRLDSCFSQNPIQTPAEDQCRDCLLLLVAPMEGAELKNI